MKADRRPLLADVLHDGTPPGFMDTLWERTLIEVRHRKRARRRHRALLTVAVIAAGAILAWRFSHPPRLEPAPPAAFRLVRSAPLPPSMIVATRPGAVAVISSSSSAVAYVETHPGPDAIREINDEQLLGVLAGHPVVLVRSGPSHAQLVFLRPEDAGGFPVQ